MLKVECLPTLYDFISPLDITTIRKNLIIWKRHKEMLSLNELTYSKEIEVCFSTKKD